MAFGLDIIKIVCQKLMAVDQLDSGENIQRRRVIWSRWGNNQISCNFCYISYSMYITIENLDSCFYSEAK